MDSTIVLLKVYPLEIIQLMVALWKFIHLTSGWRCVQDGVLLGPGMVLCNQRRGPKNALTKIN